MRNALALTIHLGWFLFPLLAVFAFRLRRWIWTLVMFGAAGAITAFATEGYTLDEKMLVAASLGVGLCILAGAIARLGKGTASRAESLALPHRVSAPEAAVAASAPHADRFLAAWVLLFFAAALAAFYAGAARYLLPIAAPLALLAARNAAKPLLTAGVAVQLAFSLLLATAYYQYVSQYRDLAARLEPLVESRRLWFNADWGLRYYLEAIGGEHALADQPLLPQSALVTSRLGGVAAVQTLGRRGELLRTEIRTGAIPLAVVGVDSRSGNASAGFGLLPFDYGEHLLDEVVAEVIGAPEPTASHLTMAAPEAADHLMFGFYSLEQQWRWIGPRAMAMLRAPSETGSDGVLKSAASPVGAPHSSTPAKTAVPVKTAAPAEAVDTETAANPRSIEATFELVFHIPDMAPARSVTVTLDGKPIASETYPGPGGYTLQAPARVTPGQTVTVEISVDQAFRVEGDARDLGMIVTALGFVNPE